MSSHPDFAERWLEQRRAAAIALAQVAEDELRELSDEEALRRSDALLSMIDPRALPEHRWTSSGFVEQQRRFHQAKTKR